MNQQSNKILVSVIIPTYKPGAYLQECIESICQQTIAKEVFELIIVLNGCDEPYRSNINTFLAKCQGNINVRVLQTDQPGVTLTAGSKTASSRKTKSLSLTARTAAE